MPKDRKKTFSDRQSQASRAKKQAEKKIVIPVEIVPVKKIPAHVLAKKQTIKREDFSQAAARIVREATENK
jgi:hypothetical protein